jgi:hypothetical protein
MLLDTHGTHITMNGYNIWANGKEQASRKMKNVALG